MTDLTSAQIRILSLIASGVVHREAGQMWHDLTGVKMTFVVQQLIGAGWAELGLVVRPGKTIVLATPVGRQALSEHGRCGGCGTDLDAHVGLPRHVCAHTTRTSQLLCVGEPCPSWDLCPGCWRRLTGG